MGSTFWEIEPFLDQSGRRSFQILDDLGGGGVHCKMVMEGGGQIVLVNPEFVLSPYLVQILNSEVMLTGSVFHLEPSQEPFLDFFLPFFVSG